MENLWGAVYRLLSATICLGRQSLLQDDTNMVNVNKNGVAKDVWFMRCSGRCVKPSIPQLDVAF